jgi:phosphoglycolate phosphatase-like HAD superfamily hydrolase
MAAGEDTSVVLLLFDIDGTILQGAAAAHAQALRMALYEIYGVGDSLGSASGLPHVLAAGRTDMEIARELVLACGISSADFQEGLERLKRSCVDIYARIGPDDLAACVIDGMGQLLAHLSSSSEVRLSLLSGNLEPIARAKLAAAGVGQHFPAGQGAFGSDAEDRACLPAIARMRAGEEGVPHPRERTIVIGDTPRDIACARADGVRCLAVTSGPYSEHELGEADAVAQSASQLQELLEEDLRRSRTLPRWRPDQDQL